MNFLGFLFLFSLRACIIATLQREKVVCVCNIAADLPERESMERNNKLTSNAKALRRQMTEKERNILKSKD